MAGAIDLAGESKFASREPRDQVLLVIEIGDHVDRICVECVWLHGLEAPSSHACVRACMHLCACVRVCVPMGLRRCVQAIRPVQVRTALTPR